jgi:hypothetical protein
MGGSNATKEWGYQRQEKSSQDDERVQGWRPEVGKRSEGEKAQAGRGDRAKSGAEIRREDSKKEILGDAAVQYKEMLAEGQKLLVDFLRAEVAIGFTFLRSAEWAANSEHMDHARQAKEDARKAADSVRQFLGQVSVREARVEIGKGLAKLEGQIAAFLR